MNTQSVNACTTHKWCVAAVLVGLFFATALVSVVAGCVAICHINTKSVNACTTHKWCVAAVVVGLFFATALLSRVVSYVAICA